MVGCIMTGILFESEWLAMTRVEVLLYNVSPRNQSIGQPPSSLYEFLDDIIGQIDGEWRCERCMAERAVVLWVVELFVEQDEAETEEKKSRIRCHLQDPNISNFSQHWRHCIALALRFPVGRRLGSWRTREGAAGSRIGTTQHERAVKAAIQE